MCRVYEEKGWRTVCARHKSAVSFYHICSIRLVCTATSWAVLQFIKTPESFTYRDWRQSSSNSADLFFPHFRNQHVFVPKICWWSEVHFLCLTPLFLFVESKLKWNELLTLQFILCWMKRCLLCEGMRVTLCFLSDRADTWELRQRRRYLLTLASSTSPLQRETPDDGMTRSASVQETKSFAELSSSRATQKKTTPDNTTELKLDLKRKTTTYSKKNNISLTKTSWIQTKAKTMK